MGTGWGAGGGHFRLRERYERRPKDVRRCDKSVIVALNFGGKATWDH